MERAYDLFKLTAAVALFLLFLMVVEGSFSESCQCFFLPACHVDENGVSYRYYQCRGSCAAYSRWSEDYGCGLNRSRQ